MSGAMAYKQLGNSGLKVSELCLGGMTLGSFHSMGLPVAGEEEGVRILDRFVEKGGNFIDTANWIYGDSEVVIGKWMESRKNREKLVVATKVGTGENRGPNQGGLGRKHIKAQIDESLQRLKTDYIDLYQCHVPDNVTPIEETLRTLDELVRSGKIHFIGLSNFLPAKIQKAVDLTKQLGLSPIVSLQPQYHMLCRSTEWELMKVCIDEGLGVIPWSPLAGGWLAGKYSRASATKAAAAGSRAEWMDKLGFSKIDETPEQTWQIVEAIDKISKETGHSASQVSLRWLLQKPGVTAPIVGTRSLAQLDDNLGAVGWSLTPEQMTTLDAVSEIDIPYPYGGIMPKKKATPATKA